MLDIEIDTAPDQKGTDIVSLAEMKQHLRLANTSLDTDIVNHINEAADKLHGPDGELNRTIFPTTWVRYLREFPSSGVIKLPFPPLLEVISVEYDDGGSPMGLVDPAKYVVSAGKLVGEIELKTGQAWPSMTAGPRKVAVTFRAGYTEYPKKLKRMVKILAAHYFANPEAAHMELRMTVNRAIEFGMEDLRAALRISPSYDDWE